jgi:hypothetical protein
MPSSARPVAAAHWPGTAIAASGTRIAAPGTRIAAAGTRIAAAGTRIAAAGTRPDSPSGANSQLSVSLPLWPPLPRGERPESLSRPPRPLSPRSPGPAAWSRRRLRRWSARSPSGLRMRLSVASSGSEFGWSGLFLAGR